jgi:hypothetical protein
VIHAREVLSNAEQVVSGGMIGGSRALNRSNIARLDNISDWKVGQGDMQPEQLGESLAGHCR